MIALARSRLPLLAILAAAALIGCARPPVPTPTPGQEAAFVSPLSPLATPGKLFLFSPLPTPSPRLPLPGWTPLPTKLPPPTPLYTATPLPAWPVIIPATATPGGTPPPTRTTVLDLRPTSAPLPTERYEAMIRALEPLPTFEPAIKGELPVQRVEMQPQAGLPVA